jgi:hypothetical protein
LRSCILALSFAKSSSTCPLETLPGGGSITIGMWESLPKTAVAGWMCTNFFYAHSLLLLRLPATISKKWKNPSSALRRKRTWVHALLLYNYVYISLLDTASRDDSGFFLRWFRFLLEEEERGRWIQRCVYGTRSARRRVLYHAHAHWSRRRVRQHLSC